MYLLTAGRRFHQGRSLIWIKGGQLNLARLRSYDIGVLYLTWQTGQGSTYLIEWTRFLMESETCLELAARSFQVGGSSGFIPSGLAVWMRELELAIMVLPAVMIGSIAMRAWRGNDIKYKQNRETERDVPQKWVDDQLLLSNSKLTKPLMKQRDQEKAFPKFMGCWEPFLNSTWTHMSCVQY